MDLNIKNYGNKILIPMLLDIVIYALFYNFFYLVCDYKINFILNLTILGWIFLSYIFGRYHDFRNINIKVIIKNTFKSIFLSLVLVIICFFLERLFIFNSLNINSIANLSYFYVVYGLLSSVINLLFNFYFYKKKSNNKWFILESNRLLKYLEEDNI